MHQSLTLVTTIAVAFGLALILGFTAARLKMPALVGYLAAGIILGPWTPGFVADIEITGQLAEIGIMLLMFGSGLHFSLRELLSVRRIALPGAIAQILIATALAAGTAMWWDWPLAAAMVFGFALSVASTVVLVRALESKGMLDSVNGRIAVGWLVVQDLAMVLVLFLLPPLATALAAGSALSARDIGIAFGRTLLEVTAFVALMLIAGRRVLPWILWQVTRTGSHELFTLCIVAAAVSIAYGSAQLFGVSYALGAFFAGMVLRESQFSQRAAQETVPLRDAFAVLFFVSVGMLFNPAVVLNEPLKVLIVVAIIMVGNPMVAAILVLLLRYPLTTALTVAASLAQIGEFSFILSGVGLSRGLLPPEGQSLILAGSLISIALNPLVFSAIDPLLGWLRARSELSRRLERPEDPLAELPMSTDRKYLADQVVLVGYGRVGRHIAKALHDRRIPFVVVEEDRQLVEQLRHRGQAAVYGNAVEAATLIQAHVAEARMLVIATPETVEVRRMIQAASALNPAIEIVVRSHDEEEAELLERERAARVFVGERELARAMADHVIGRIEAPVASSGMRSEQSNA